MFRFTATVTVSPEDTLYLKAFQAEASRGREATRLPARSSVTSAITSNCAWIKIAADYPASNSLLFVQLSNETGSWQKEAGISGQVLRTRIYPRVNVVHIQFVGAKNCTKTNWPKRYRCIYPMKRQTNFDETIVLRQKRRRAKRREEAELTGFYSDKSKDSRTSHITSKQQSTICTYKGQLLFSFLAKVSLLSIWRNENTFHSMNKIIGQNGFAFLL